MEGLIHHRFLISYNKMGYTLYIWKSVRLCIWLYKLQILRHKLLWLTAVAVMKTDIFTCWNSQRISPQGKRLSLHINEEEHLVRYRNALVRQQFGLLCVNDWHVHSTTLGLLRKGLRVVANDDLYILYFYSLSILITPPRCFHFVGEEWKHSTRPKASDKASERWKPEYTCCWVNEARHHGQQCKYGSGSFFFLLSGCLNTQPWKYDRPQGLSVVVFFFFFFTF